MTIQRWKCKRNAKSLLQTASGNESRENIEQKAVNKKNARHNVAVFYIWTQLYETYLLCLQKTVQEL